MWSLVYQNQRQSFAFWGISHAQRTLRNQSVDSVTLEVERATLPCHLLFGEPVKIYCSQKLWFQGIITETPSFSTIQKEYRRYVISGPWWFLERTIYQQKWKEISDVSDENAPLGNIYKSHLILGQNEEGNALTIGEQIKDVIRYLSEEAKISIALDPQMDLPIAIPYDECKDLSCAEVIQRLLRWVPDTTSFFDYSSHIPCLYLKRHTQLETFAVTIGQRHSPLKKIRIRPRYDLQIPSVVLKFEKTHATNGKIWTSVETQAYPTNADGITPKSLVMTIELEGSRATYIRQKIATKPIEPESIAWWKDHLPGLEDIPAENITIEEMKRTSELPRELTEGSIADWMKASVEVDLIQCYISYTSDEESIYRRRVAIKLRATDAMPKVYQWLSSYSSEENVPPHLAEQLYNSVSYLPFEGHLEFEAGEITGSYMGKKINLLGGEPTWEAMHAQVQEVTEQLETGRINLTLGPAKHLGAADFIEFTRSNRHRLSVRNSVARSSGEAEGNGCIDQGKHTQLENSAYGPGKYQKMIFTHPEAPATRSITIDATALSRDLTIQLREENVCESGKVKKRLSLASEAFLETTS